MPASHASDDADASMLDDATSTSSADILAADLSDSNQPTTPIHAYHTSSQFPSEPTPPHTGADIRNAALTSAGAAGGGPSLNANGKRALPSSAMDLRSPAVVDALGHIVSSEFESTVPAAAGMKWQAGEDGILVEVPDDDSPMTSVPGGAAAAPRQQDEPGARWMNKKAQDEMRKAMEQIVDREYMIKKKYGDVVLDPRSQTTRS